MIGRGRAVDAEFKRLGLSALAQPSKIIGTKPKINAFFNEILIKNAAKAAEKASKKSTPKQKKGGKKTKQKKRKTRKIKRKTRKIKRKTRIYKKY